VANEDVDVNEYDGVGDTVDPEARLREEELEMEVKAVFSVLVLWQSVWSSRFSPFSPRMEELSRHDDESPEGSLPRSTEYQFLKTF
jgi:hypothetical protein